MKSNRPSIYSRVSRPGIVLLHVFWCLIVRAQVPDFNYRQLGSEDGLNNPNVFNIQQHPNGLMYITTQNGIYSYDGYSFTRLGIDSLRSNALETAVLQDEEHLLLSIRHQGVSSYHLLSGRYESPRALRVAENNADQMLSDERFVYLLTTSIRLTVIEKSSGKVFPDMLREGTGANLPYCIFRSAEGKILAGRSDGLYEVNGGVQKKLPVLQGGAVTALAGDRQGRLYAASGGAIHVLEKGRLSSIVQPVYDTRSSVFDLGGEKSISRIVADEFGRLWFTASPGENLYLHQSGKTYDIFDALGIAPSLINCLYRDDRQNIWIGTMSDGVYMIQNTFFNSFNFRFNSKVLNVNKVHLQENLLVAATSNGLFGLNILNTQSKILSQPDNVFLEPVYGITEINGALYYAKRNEINMSPSIFLDSHRAYRFRPVSARNLQSLPGGRTALATWDGYILLANSDGSEILDTLVAFSDYRVAVNDMLQSGSTLYVGTNNGLYTYDFESKTQSAVASDALNFNINDLALIGGVVFAAHDGGITNVQSRTLFRLAGPFSLNGVKKIIEFQDQVWLGTLDGVYICDRELRPLKVLNKGTGLLSNSVNDITFHQGFVAIATVRGVSIASFRNILRYSTRLRPVTVNYVLSGSDILRSKSNTFRLPAGSQDVTLYFSSPLFHKSNKQYFRYRRNEGEWSYQENLGQLSFPTLAGGSHRIEISSSSDNISWSEPTVVLIEKEQRITETQLLNWLIILGAFILMGAVALIWVRRVKQRAKRRLNEEQQVNLLKHQAMNALLSPHFIFNSLTSIQNYINTNNSLRASEYLAKFSRLIRMIIEKAASSHISLYDELARLTYYLELEKERFKNKFDYEIKVDENLNTHEVMIPNMIIQPYVENSILHGILPTHAPGKLWVTFRREDSNKLVITIEDNGIGLIRAAEHAKTGHKSLGTSTIRNILEVNSKLTGKSQKVSMHDKSTTNPASTGTVITIELEL